jgi:hypothetical protein
VRDATRGKHVAIRNLARGCAEERELHLARDRSRCGYTRPRPLTAGYRITVYPREEKGRFCRFSRSFDPNRSSIRFIRIFIFLARCRSCYARGDKSISISTDFHLDRRRARLAI